MKKIKCAVFSFVLNIKPLRYFSFFLQANKQNLSRDQPAPAGTSNILKQICPFCIIPHIFSCSIARLVLFFKPSTYLFHHFLFFFSFFFEIQVASFSFYTWIFVLQLFLREPVLQKQKQKQLKDIYLVGFLEILITW